MHKIVVERERYGSGDSSRKWGKRLPYIAGCDYEDEPKRVSSARRRQYVSPKGFTDVLNPVKGFLRKSLGRPWNEVYSELRRGLDVRKVTGRHVFQHLDRMVQQHCFEDEKGRIKTSHASRYWSPWVEGFYVHSRTGLLSYARRTSTAERRRQSLQHRTVEGFWIDEKRAYRILDGIWYVVRYELIFVHHEQHEHCQRHAWDVIQRTKVQLRAGNNVLPVQKKQCSREEIAKVRRLIAQWERSLCQRPFRFRRDLRVILGICLVCKKHGCSGHSGIYWNIL
jgi:hypothetical protein